MKTALKFKLPWFRDEKRKIKKDLKKARKKKKELDTKIKDVQSHPINKYLSLAYFVVSIPLLLSSIFAGSPLLIGYLIGTIYISAYAYRKASK